jgi:hypothetical protein
MRPHLHLFVTQSDRNEAVDRIMAAILDAYQPRLLDRREPSGAHSLTAAALPPLVRIAEPGCWVGGGESARRPDSHGLLPFERLLLACVVLVAALVVAGNLLR